MKAILIAAAALMAGASVYGFIDYSKKSDSREFKALYREEKKETPPAPKDEIKSGKTETTKEAITPELKKETTKPAKSKGKKKARKISFESFSRARMEKFEMPVEKKE